MTAEALAKRAKQHHNTRKLKSFKKETIISWCFATVVSNNTMRTASSNSTSSVSKTAAMKGAATKAVTAGTVLSTA